MCLPQRPRASAGVKGPEKLQPRAEGHGGDEAKLCVCVCVCVCVHAHMGNHAHMWAHGEEASSAKNKDLQMLGFGGRKQRQHK